MDQITQGNRSIARKGYTNQNFIVQSRDVKEKKIQAQQHYSFADISPKSNTQENKSSIQQIISYFNNYVPQSNFQINQLKNSSNLKLKKYENYTYFGEMVNGKRQGKGILLYNSGRIYEGYWQKDMKNGKGFQKFTNNSKYHGSFVNGKPEGYGTFTWSNGQIYQGQWVNGLKHGSGMWKGQRGDSYIGEWKFGKADGCGVHTWINGDRYEGQFKQCLKNGQGTQKFSNGDMYTGNYIKGKPQGFGQYIWANKSSFKGNFKNGYRNGFGVWKQKPGDSDRYEGQYVNDKKSGHGVFTWKNGNVYKGEFFNDLRNGYGEMHWNDGSTYKGYWKNGIQHGEGQIKLKDEKPKKGIFEQNIMVKLISQNYQDGESLDSRVLPMSHKKNRKLHSQISEKIHAFEKSEMMPISTNNKTEAILTNIQDQFQSFDQGLPKKLYKPLLNLRSKKIYGEDKKKMLKTTEISILQKQKQNPQTKKQSKQKLQTINTNNSFTNQLKPIKKLLQKKSNLPSYFYYNIHKIERPSATTVPVVSHLNIVKKGKRLHNHQKTETTEQQIPRKKLNMSLRQKSQSNFGKISKSPRLNAYF